MVDNNLRKNVIYMVIENLSILIVYNNYPLKYNNRYHINFTFYGRFIIHSKLEAYLSEICYDNRYKDMI